QVRKVPQADQRKAAEALSKQEPRDPFERYGEPASGGRRAASGIGTAAAARSPEPALVAPPARRSPPPARLVPEPIDDGEFEDPLYLDRPPAARPKAIPKPAMRKPE